MTTLVNFCPVCGSKMLTYENPPRLKCAEDHAAIFKANKVSGSELTEWDYGLPLAIPAGQLVDRSKPFTIPVTWGHTADPYKATAA
jgi:hypothetical protein